MKYGIYYAFWEKQWSADYLLYILKARKLGFDILEIATADFENTSDHVLDNIRKASEDNNIILTGGYGPHPKNNIGSSDSLAVDNALKFYNIMFKKMARAGIRILGGALYSYWPVNYIEPFDKAADRERSLIGMKRLASMAEDFGITLNMEALNRFEGYLINTADECISYVKDIGKKNVKVMLDTFHMNIEEDDISEAIIKTGHLLGHLHIGERNRKLPGMGDMPWGEISTALHKIKYNGYVVMEPFMMMGGQVGQDIKVWRDLTNGISKEQIDIAVAESLKYIKSILEY
jgi:D-psicose/D-tagatose/L-ribulose 3-epimerase